MQTDTATPGMPRRAFLVTSALASAGAMIAPAAGSPTRSADPGRWPAPQLARLLPRTTEDADPRTLARCARVPSRSSALLTGPPCRLRVTPLSHPLQRIEGAADLELHYPHPDAWTHLWAVEPTPIHAPVGEPHAMSAPVESLAPASNGRVRLRVARRSPQGRHAHAIDLTHEPGSHLLAIPVTRDARTPAWRRCDIDATEPHHTTIADPWRSADAANGCVLLRIDLIPTRTTTPAHGGD